MSKSITISEFLEKDTVLVMILEKPLITSILLFNFLDDWLWIKSCNTENMWDNFILDELHQETNAGINTLELVAVNILRI